MNMGVLYFRQLADMDDDQLVALDDRLLANGRVVREDWRGQAKAMLKQASRNTV
jgi:predicted flap endonuclease-1-like 5' DNA nuclease